MEIIIEAGKTEKNYWRDLWRYRELFYILAWRDIKVRYKQTVIGAAWSIIRPLLTMVVFTLLFSKVAGLKSVGNVPYAILVYAAMLPWQFFSNALSESSNSLIGNSNLITKVYFPRMIIPLSSIIVSLIDFIISFSILLLLFVWYGYSPGWQVVFLPVFIFLTFTFSFGLGLLLTTLNVKYRDFRYIIPFIIQFGLYVSPVGFDSNIIPMKWRWLYNMNPMVGIIDGFRWSLLNGSTTFNNSSLLYSLILILIFLILGIFLFRKFERQMADKI